MWTNTMSLTAYSKCIRFSVVASVLFFAGCSSVQFREGSVFNDDSAQQAETASNESGTENTSSTPNNRRTPVQQNQEEIASKTGSDSSSKGVQSDKFQINDTVERPKPANFRPNPYIGSSQLSKSERDQQIQYLKQTHQLIRKNQLTQAESILKDTTKLKPTSGVHFQLGQLELKRKNPEKALKEFEKAIRTNPKNVHAYNQIALIHRSMGAFDQAKDYYTRALNIWPNYLTAWYNLGILEDLYLGNKKAALGAYSQYLSNADQLDEPPKEYKNVELWVKDLQRNI